ncbi:hypothetical protein [Mycolicibacterium anyangense]|nr:hypothetical protein [Mycolicibacterium anyangense]
MGWLEYASRTSMKPVTDVLGSLARTGAGLRGRRNDAEFESGKD